MATSFQLQRRKRQWQPEPGLVRLASEACVSYCASVFYHFREENSTGQPAIDTQIAILQLKMCAAGHLGSHNITVLDVIHQLFAASQTCKVDVAP
jgi:hypothetical protein